MCELPPISKRTLSSAFDKALKTCPDNIAHVAGGDAWTFAQSYEHAMRIAGGLHQLGAQRQQTIALMLDNSMDAMHVWTGITLGGAIEVPINTAHKGHFLSHVLNDAQTSIAIVEDTYAERVERVAEELTNLRTLVVRGDISAADRLRERFRVIGLDEVVSADPLESRPNRHDDLIAYMYTSGTTGMSKGVEISHVHAYTYSSREDGPRGPSPSDRVLVTLPMFHLAGQWVGCYQSLIHQNTCVIEPGFSASKFWSVVRENKITYTTLLGAMAEILQQQPPQADDADNPLKYATMHPLASDVLGFAERFGIEIGTGYGMSEIGGVMTGSWESLQPGEAGRARDGYQLRVVDPAGADVQPDEVGELWVKPDDPLMVMNGYHNLPDKTADTIVDGWVHTGDAFKTDDDGHFYFVDRMKDALRRRGENISSFEVEKVINEYPQVYESAVVAVPSDLTEDDIKAVIVTREGQSIDPVELIEFLVDRMPYFMVPRYLQFASSLPRTPTQKVQKHLLRDADANQDVWDREAAGITITREGRRA
ncbi:crotonobetaine/carnitine-CoA ligase [Antricoccus suffuscus]|uniref:Crotonobetaine/carnitine-CoA ligase n=1 Tax=Antricoccus suffuscus TaxID=1629062 RepID=A0A2T0ZWZ1_9ACTN|nr:AMP-binding protein [Antricoccus suffuscus]PRZ40866.1 crotonobetaine/carnitine-CoA ligase [Antricoccus suffuscus]